MRRRGTIWVFVLPMILVGLVCNVQASTRQHIVELRVYITNSGGPGRVTIYLPHMESWRYQRQTLLAAPRSDTFELGTGGEVKIGLRYQVTLAENPGADSPAVDPPELVVDDDIRLAAQIVTRVEASNEARAFALLQFVNRWVRYDTAVLPRPKPPTSREVLASRIGVCEDFALLYTALCRALNIPARMVYGVRTAGNDSVVDLHTWVEIDIGAGWRPVEPTGYGRLGLPPGTTYIFWSRVRPEIRTEWKANGFLPPALSIKTAWVVG